MPQPITIKGTREGLQVTLGEGPWVEELPALLQAIDAQGEFFHGAKVALQVGEREIGAAELGGLVRELADRDINLWAVLSDSPLTQGAAADLGLASQIPKPAGAAEEQAPSADGELPGEDAVLVHRTLRSGHRIHFPGHVVVIGDVNPGSEIVAGGDVVVWGRLRGMVHAGASGNESAVVCALDLTPMQLRIANQIAVSPERRGKPRPEMIRIHDGQLVAEGWGDDHRR